MRLLTDTNDLSSCTGSRASTSDDEAAEIRVLLAARLRSLVSDLALTGPALAWDRLVENAAESAFADLLALVDRDPAALTGKEALQAYRCFEAVLAHRIANPVLENGPAAGLGSARACRVAARRISEQARVSTGVELHPGATIGRRFVVDHGTGTVVGETARLGDDCYILQGVVLGALKIADNPSGPRHPRIGHRVEIGAFARVLGPVTVGNDAVIGCHALVREDVPPGARVSLLPATQVTEPAREPALRKVVLPTFRASEWPPPCP